MEEPFLHALKLILGDRYTDSMDEIYKLTIKFILTNVCSMYDSVRMRQINKDYLLDGETCNDDIWGSYCDIWGITYLILIIYVWNKDLVISAVSFRKLKSVEAERNKSWHINTWLIIRNEEWSVQNHSYVFHTHEEYRSTIVPDLL